MGPRAQGPAAPSLQVSEASVVAELWRSGREDEAGGPALGKTQG